MQPHWIGEKEKLYFSEVAAAQSPDRLEVEELSEGIRSNVLDFIPL